MTGIIPDLSSLSSLNRLRLERNNFIESILPDWLPKSLDQLSIDSNDMTDTMNNTLCSGNLDITVDCYINELQCSCCTNCL